MNSVKTAQFLVLLEVVTKCRLINVLCRDCILPSYPFGSPDLKQLRAEVAGAMSVAFYACRYSPTSNSIAMRCEKLIKNGKLRFIKP